VWTGRQGGKIVKLEPFFGQTAQLMAVSTAGCGFAMDII
jgi:hypothetical protein